MSAHRRTRPGRRRDAHGILITVCMFAFFHVGEYTAQLMWGACMCLQIPNSCLRYGFALDYPPKKLVSTDFTCPRRWRIMFNCLFVVAA